MTQEDKKLLLQDLCARLPYDVKVCYENNTYYLNEINPACKEIMISVLIQDENRQWCAESVLIENIKPYLRPMSSMTDEEREEWTDLFLISVVTELEQYSDDEAEDIAPKLYASSHVKSLNWLNKHHFDYNGLIEKGLAIEVTEENNPYKEK